MFRIGQLAGIYKISGKTLRYYDELGLLKPQYVDQMTGYRYYTSSQIPVLNEIFLLKEMGLSLKEIAYLMQREEEKDNTVLKMCIRDRCRCGRRAGTAWKRRVFCDGRQPGGK